MRVRVIRLGDEPAKEKSAAQRIRHTVAGVLLSPPYWAAAALRQVPGLGIHLLAARLGISMILAGRDRATIRAAFRLVFRPMDSVRYFELDTIWRWLPRESQISLLDVSSPRLLSALWLFENRRVRSTMINPDMADILETSTLLCQSGLRRRCMLAACLAGTPPFRKESFDVVCSISVLEHIPDDVAALRGMWHLLKPGGRLLLTVPCEAERSEEYIDRNVYGILPPDERGLWFWQRFYDAALLHERIFAITGAPRRAIVYGERAPGTLQENAMRKWKDGSYPYWREPYMMGVGFKTYDTIGEMPGQGVIAMEFRR